MDGFLRGSVVAAIEQNRPPVRKGAVFHDVIAHGVEGLHHFRAFGPLAHSATCSPPDEVVPIDKPERSGCNGLVASINTLPERSPSPASTSLAAGHGMENKSTSFFAVSANFALRAFF